MARRVNTADTQSPSFLPSSSTTFSCASDSALFQLSITTDNYGKEDTSWSLVHSNSKTVFDVEVGTLEKETKYIYEKCLPKNSCFRFTILDSYGDGICCEYGEGAYSITYDGSEVASGGDFGASATHIMGKACSPSSPSVSLQPSSSPSTKPS
eukprot:13308458-Ditylum_brightwellii.AAC.1